MSRVASRQVDSAAHTLASVAIRNFTVGPKRGLFLAQADDLPNLVVIAGPNGAGKSSLLEVLRQDRVRLVDLGSIEQGTQVLYVGPERTWRQQPLNRSNVWPLYVPPRQILERREPSGFDNDQSYIKTVLAQLQEQQRSMLATAWEGQDRRIEPGTVPDLFEPLKRLVATVLPHLRFVRVADDERQGIIQCLFQAATDDGMFDIDELSSGEKSVIALLIPLIEELAQQAVTPPPTAPGVVPLTMLIDEPEQHLHPLLQIQVLQYFRDLAREEMAQFILTTHSTTLLDVVTDEELYLLSPAAMRPGENQLARLTTRHERLEVARELTGSTHVLTRSKPIVFVEGEPDRRGVSSDARLITQLLPQTASWALVPGGAKTQVVHAVHKLREDQLDLPGTPVFGLVDADRDADTANEHVISWPVAMIENLLLDAEAIYQALRPFGTQTSARSVAVVQEALDNAALGRVEDELRLRVERHLKPRTLRAQASELTDISALEFRARQHTEAWINDFRALNLPALQADARGEVDAILAAETQLDRFRGKEILRVVYNSLGVAGTLSHAAFPSAVAVHAAARARTKQLTSSALQQITLYFPHGLPEALRAGGEQGRGETLASECARHRAAWAGKAPVASGREDLRRRIFEFARTTDGQQRQVLVRFASEIGTA